MSEPKVLNELRKGREKTEAAVEEDIDNLREDVAQLTEHLKKLTAQIAAQAVGVTKYKMDNVTDGVQAAAVKAKKRALAATEDLEETVANNPIGSMIVSVGLGIIISQLLRR